MVDEILNMKVLDGRYAVCRFSPEEDIPAWAYKGEFFSIAKTEDELSVLCLEENIEGNVQKEGEWKVLKVLGPLDFSLVGILSKISTVLANESISIFAVSTYDTDYILVKESNLAKSINVLNNNGYLVVR